MTIHDISLTISPTLPTWPSDPGLVIERLFDMERGDGLNVTRWSSSVHLGTHVDAPLHFVADGASVDQIDPQVLIGPAMVAPLLEADAIGAAELEALGLPPGTTRLLLKTRNSEIWARGETEFQTEYVAIEEDGAHWLVAHGIRLIGVDYLSVSPFHDSTPTHVALLQAGIVIVEGLNLSGIRPGEYQLICLPLKIADSDGAPARAVLMEIGEGF